MEDPAFISEHTSKLVSTPYGDPSSKLIIGAIADIPVVIISRHGKGHSINPTSVNYRANVWSLKEEGCTHILAATACGSLRERIEPGHFVFPDQFIDRTCRRQQTFFGSGIVAHFPLADPVDSKMIQVVADEAKALEQLKVHVGGTYVTMEGPQFSTRAESDLYRSWGAKIIWN